MTEKPPITIKQIAAKAGLAVSTVSYALRNSPQVSRDTCQRVQDLARSMGYRPNARVSGLMSHIRQAQSRGGVEPLAFVWMDSNKEECQTTPFLAHLIEGARTRANQLGYTLLEFWLSDKGMSIERICKIIDARGINGVIFSAPRKQDSIVINADMSHFAVAIIGSAKWTPEFHRAAHDHYGGMIECIHQLRQMGSQRPATIIDMEVNERCRRSYQAAFLSHAPQDDPRKYLFTRRFEQFVELSREIKRLQVDGLIINSRNFIGESIIRRVEDTFQIPVASLYLEPDQEYAQGINQCYDKVAAKAVDLISSQLNTNEYGIPEFPHVLHFPGRWMTTRKIPTV